MFVHNFVTDLFKSLHRKDSGRILNLFLVIASVQGLLAAVSYWPTFGCFT